MRSWPVTNDRLNEIKEASDGDFLIQEAIKFIIEGWPEKPGIFVNDHYHLFQFAQISP